MRLANAIATVIELAEEVEPSDDIFGAERRQWIKRQKKAIEALREFALSHDFDDDPSDDDDSIVRYLIGCLNSENEATLVPVKVQFRMREGTEDSADAAWKWAEGKGYCEPMLTFDETDALDEAVWKTFDWENAPLVRMQGN